MRTDLCRLKLIPGNSARQNDGSHVAMFHVFAETPPFDILPPISSRRLRKKIDESEKIHGTYFRGHFSQH